MWVWVCCLTGPNCAIIAIVMINDIIVAVVMVNDTIIAIVMNHDQYHHCHCHEHCCPVARTVVSVTIGKNRLVRRWPHTPTTMTQFMVIFMMFEMSNDKYDGDQN